MHTHFHLHLFFFNACVTACIYSAIFFIRCYLFVVHFIVFSYVLSFFKSLRYYAASAEGGTSKRQIFKVQINGQKADQNTVECLTCSVLARHLHEPVSPVITTSTSGSPTPPKPESKKSNRLNFTSSHPHQFHANSSCRYSNAILSPSLEYYVHECLGPSIPYVEVRSLPTNKLVKLLQVNQQLRQDSIDKAFPRKLQIKVPLLVDNTPWKRTIPDYVAVELFLPPGLREDESTLYPLLVWT